ncbi:MAG: cell surface protein SprA, partial [Rhodothermales bacterium]|nr:cell surface protein SprA [Rhodothermales bacterium]
VYYEPPGSTPSKTLPAVGGTQTALQILGLDRVNANQALSPDDQFDFLVNYTIVPGDGTLIFPYLQPFGDRLENVILEGPGTPQAKDGLIETFVFERLYTEKKANARRDSQHDVYRIRGSYKGNVQSFYDLRAYSGLVPGSVRVTSGGTPLQEGTDYYVDYNSGTVEIINPAFLTAGREIDIEYEQNSFVNIQKKTLLGLRADYILDDRFSMGATLMRMNEKSPIDKFRIGEEPISNTIWGVDGTLELEPMWLTRAIDRVPLLQTKEPSRISLTGEFAQLRPNHTQTIAFERTREDLQDAGRDFSSDELRGTSYIDDFEGFENTFSLMQPGSWGLSAAPDSVAAVDRTGVQPGATADSLRTNWRSSFAWYRINANMLREIPTIAYNGDAIRIFRIDEVFPNRDTRAEIDPTLETIDIYFNPRTRGPYNYTRDLQGFLNNPRDTWGGMMQRLPDGFTDFSLKNIDFVEFVFRPFPENPAEDAGRDAKLYVDLGSISEDIIPDEKLNNEDGLSMSTITETSINKWGRLPNSTQNSVVDIDDETNRTEDLGLDGVASAGGDFPEFASEQAVFSDFLNSLSGSITDPAYQAERAKALVDPSGDDYHYFGNSRFFENSDFFPNGATFQQRFTHYFAGQEMNAFEAQTKLADNTSVRRGNSRFPDSEDRNLNSSVDTDNSYFQYEVPLSRSALDSLARPTAVDDFIVGEIKGAEGEGTGWYQVRIPVQRFTRRVGDIQDFSLIESIRIWTTGHDVPITMRFASLELVGSQWQKSESVTAETDTPMDTIATGTNLRISSINNEENADIYAPPLGAVVSQSRLASGRVQNAREQALVLRVENLMPGSQRAIFKTQNQGLDLLKYANMRMFVHMHGMLRDGRNLSDLSKDEGRSKAKLFVRLGANETNDYYEYEMPLTPSAETSGSPEVLWQTNVDYNGVMQDLGSMNIELGAFNQLKVARDRAAFPTDSVFYNVRNGELVTADAPDAEVFAPPGTRLGIKGTPSLGKINSIVIGVRNAADSTMTGFEHIIEDMTVWINELRVSGYDQTNGWAALGNADFQLADIGSIKATVDRRTDGFGSLSSSLGDRDQINQDNWSVTSQFNVNKLLPDRYGWGVPLNVQVSSNTSTPRFAPNRGDVRLEEITAQIDERDDLTEAEKEEAKTNAIEEAQTHSFTTSVSTRVSKSGSDSPILKKTVDALAFSYSQSTSDGRSPTQEMNDTWRWASTLSYQIRNTVKTVRPLFFLEPIPVLRQLSDIDFNYIPNSISTSGTFTRNFSESQERAVVSPGDTSNVPLSIRFPLRETHAFNHDRSVQLQYNPFGFLNLSFDTNTQQSLNSAGVDTVFSTVTQNQVIPGLTPDEALAQGRIDSTTWLNAFEQRTLETNSATSVIGDFVTGRTSARAERHGQRFTAGFRPRLNNISALNWMQLSNITYTASYTWQNGAVGRLTGASIRNNVDLQSNITFRLQDLWRKFGFYEAIEDAQQEYRKDRQDARQSAQAARARQQNQARVRQAGDGADEGGQSEDAARQTAGEDEDSGPGISGRLSSLARQLFLTATGIRDFNVSYNGSRTSSSSNVGTPVLGDDGLLVGARTPFNLLDAFRGDGPSLGYRFGFNRSIDLENRILDPSLQITDVRQNSDRFQGRTTLNPSQALTINLNWNLEYGTSETWSFRPITNMDDIVTGVAATPTREGRNSASIWALGASYLDMFESQLGTYRSDLEASGEENPIVIGDEDGDGRVVLTNESVVQDFRKSFIRGGSTLDSRNLQPFPRPTWQVTYSGASKWPLIRRVARSLSIAHGYNADYSTDYTTNTAFASEDSLNTVDLGGRQIQYAVEPFRTGTVRINERFQPLIGVDISWKFGLQTGVRWSTNNSYSLSTANFEVSESETKDLTVDFGYQKTGLTLPFLSGRRLQNRLNLSVSITRSNTQDQRLRLRRALEQAATDPDFVSSDALAGDNVSLVTAHRRTIITPQISYQFSNRVSANFTLRYEKFDSEDSRQPSATNINGTFNIRVSISN